MHKNTQLLFKKYALPFFKPGLRVLEIGPDAQPSTFQGILQDTSHVWHTLDIASRNDIPLTYRTADEYKFPIPDRSYDVVLSANVIEHVRKIWRWMPELARVTRPRGHIITIAPVSWEYHEAPVDCWRIYPAGMRALCEDAGLRVLLCEWEALGISRLRRLGGSVQLWQKLSGVLNLLHWKLKLPWEAAFDIITIAQVPPQNEPPAS
jgi:SAM-dependent methyltransferase